MHRDYTKEAFLRGRRRFHVRLLVVLVVLVGVGLLVRFTWQQHAFVVGVVAILAGALHFVRRRWYILSVKAGQDLLRLRFLDHGRHASVVARKRDVELRKLRTAGIRRDPVLLIRISVPNIVIRQYAIGDWTEADMDALRAWALS